jgi:hypothetical protein
MRIDAERREGGFKVAVLGLPDVAAIRELQSKSFGGICGIWGILTGPVEDVGVPGRDPDAEAVPDDGALLPSRNSLSLGEWWEWGDAEVLEVIDAGETLRESLVAGG